VFMPSVSICYFRGERNVLSLIACLNVTRTHPKFDSIAVSDYFNGIIVIIIIIICIF